MNRASNARRPRASRMAAPERRAQLLDVASKVITREGLGALTMERVADAAEVSKPVLYALFRNRADLLLALFTTYWNDVDQAVAARLREGATLDERLVGLVEGVFDAIEKGGPVVQLLLTTDTHEPTVEEARRRRFRQAERQWSTAYQAAGLPEQTADAAAAILRAALNGATGYWLRSGRISRELCMRTVLTIMRSGLEALSET